MEGKLENENAKRMTQITLKIYVSAKFMQPTTKWFWFSMDKTCHAQLVKEPVFECLLWNLCRKYTKGKFIKIVFQNYFKGKIIERGIFGLFDKLVARLNIVYRANCKKEIISANKFAHQVCIRK
jgi:hypothetical protein